MRVRRGDIPELGHAVQRRGAGASCPEPSGSERTERELDRALLRWFAARLATVGAEACETEVTDYLIAEALSELEHGDR